MHLQNKGLVACIILLATACWVLVITLLFIRSTDKQSVYLTECIGYKYEYVVIRRDIKEVHLVCKL